MQIRMMFQGKSIRRLLRI